MPRLSLHNAAIARLEAELAASEVRERQHKQSYVELERMYQVVVEDKQRLSKLVGMLADTLDQSAAALLMRPIRTDFDRTLAAEMQSIARAASAPTTTNPLALVPIEDERAAVLCEQAAARLRRQSIGTAAAERVARAAIDAEREARETA